MDAALDTVVNVVLLVIVAAGVAGLARRIGWSEPLVLVVVGIGVSFIPNVLDVELTPSSCSIGLLPPLLYAAAIRTSLVDFKANRRAILLLSVGSGGVHHGRRGLRGLVGDPGHPAGRRIRSRARWSRRRTRWRPPPWPAGSGCRGASCRSSRARA